MFFRSYFFCSSIFWCSLQYSFFFLNNFSLRAAARGSDKIDENSVRGIHSLAVLSAFSRCQCANSAYACDPVVVAAAAKASVWPSNSLSHCCNQYSVCIQYTQNDRTETKLNQKTKTLSINRLVRTVLQLTSRWPPSALVEDGPNIPSAASGTSLICLLILFGHTLKSKDASTDSPELCKAAT